MIKIVVDAYLKPIDGIVDLSGNPAKHFVVSRTTVVLLWVIPLMSWEREKAI